VEAIIEPKRPGPAESPVGSEQMPQAVNSFSIVVATANGTGSQTSNLTLLRALFKMGIPVNGKNIFPSNIQGLPTWYHIRLSKEGYEARPDKSEVLVAFNRATAEEDIANVASGGLCLYPAEWRDVTPREDVTNYAIPVRQFLREAGVKGKIGDYLANMVYVGVLAQLLGIDLVRIEEALSFNFDAREKLVSQNMAIIRAAYAWTVENAEEQRLFRVAPMDATAGKFLITGNEAAALGAIFGGVTVASWYPITPSTSLVDALNAFLPGLRRDPETGKLTCVVLQAEDELAAAGMVMGAAWMGARAMTATSGPGISLMAEFVSLGYFAELPAVIWDVQRVGPSTGLPTRTSQGDILFAYFLGHGDTKNVLLFPATVAECFEFGASAFDVAEQLQTPVLVLSDLDLGMNNWMTEPFEYPSEPLKRGKILSAEEVEARGFGRFKDIDGDGIPYRTLPGNEHPRSAFLTRGSGHNEHGGYSERPEDWESNMLRLARKFETARSVVPGPATDLGADSDVGIISLGSTWPAIEEARAQLADGGILTDFMRLRALPINGDVRDFVRRHARNYVVEMNRDGQIFQILSLELPDMVDRLVSLAHMDGMPLTARWIADAVREFERKRQ
jgi:2-oxoglutarate ferredoxin oxidoreductase subunit alpha